MALIDIAKLNAEVDKLIAAQDVEIEQMKAEIASAKEERYKGFMAAMEQYAAIAEQISPAPLIDLGFYDYYWKISFDARRHMLRFYRINDFVQLEPNKLIGYHQPYGEATAFGSSEIIDLVARWYAEHPQEFERRFEEACINTIKRKAEKANERYDATAKKYEGR